MNKLRKYIKRIIKLMSLDELKILPGHLAFNLVLTIIPIFSLVGVLGLNEEPYHFLSKLNGTVPDGVLEIIKLSLEVQNNGFNLLIFIIFTLWVASKGCRAIIIASNVMYKIKETSRLMQRIRSYVMILVLFILFAFIIVVPVFGDIILRILNIYFSNIDIISNIYYILKYPISIVLIFISIKLLYTLALNYSIKSKYMNKGALFTTVSWLLLTKIYSFHLNNYSNYNLYYGSLSNILILLLWVYLLSYLFMIGMSLNADDYFVNNKKE